MKWFSDVVEYAWKKKRDIVKRHLRSIILNQNKNIVRILDVGCGYGHYLKEYENVCYRLGIKAEIYGLDVAIKNLEFNFNFVKGDARKLPFKNRSFDIVTSTEVLEHFVEGEMFIEEVYRVLKDGGFFILTTPNRLRFTAWIRNLKYIRNDIVPGPNPEHLREYTPKELRKILEFAGFDLIKLDFIAFNPYLPIPFSIYKTLDKTTDKILKSVTKWDMIITAKK